MQFYETGAEAGKTLVLLPGTACDWQTNFKNIIPILSEKYRLICVNYDGFDGSGDIFPDMLTVTEKIEKYIIKNHNGYIDGAIGSSLGSSFVGQLIQRKNVRIAHGIFGSPDLDQCGRVHANRKLNLPQTIAKTSLKCCFYSDKLSEFNCIFNVINVKYL